MSLACIASAATAAHVATCRTREKSNASGDRFLISPWNILTSVLHLVHSLQDCEHLSPLLHAASITALQLVYDLFTRISMSVDASSGTGHSWSVH
jgi:hypothetical protein